MAYFFSERNDSLSDNPSNRKARLSVRMHKAVNWDVRQRGRNGKSFSRCFVGLGSAPSFGRKFRSPHYHCKLAVLVTVMTPSTGDASTSHGCRQE